jgi:calcium-dependent protein kinase
MMEHTHGHPNISYDLVDEFHCAGQSSTREALKLETGDLRIIKGCNKLFDMGGRDPEADLWNEIRLLQKANHPNIMKLFETFEDDTHIFMVLELCTGEELFDRLLEAGGFSEKDSMRFAYQMTSAINHLHELQICHRDIQPESFVMVNRGDLAVNSVKLLSLSTSKDFGQGLLTTKVCTLHYVAPEILNTEPGYSEKIDIWSLGVLIYVMLAGTPPFDADSDILTLQAVKQGTYEWAPEERWDSVSADTKSVITNMLVVDPQKRWDIKKVKKSKVLQAALEDGAMSVCLADKQSTSPKGEDDKRKANFRTVFAMLAEIVTNAQIDSLRNFFKEVDAKEVGHGMVDFGSVRQFLLDMVPDGDETMVQMLMSVSGKVNYPMCLATMSDKRRAIRRDAAQAVFTCFDIDRNGEVSLYEIAQALARGLDPDERFAGRSGTKDISNEEVSMIWDEMRQVFGQLEVCVDKMDDKEMTFEEFFQQLPNSNQDISF